jgi:hypothetical protein
MIELEIMNFLAGILNIPFAEYLTGPWEWFLALGTITKVVFIIFGSLGFYLVLRLFYIIVESILSIFH